MGWTGKASRKRQLLSWTMNTKQNLHRRENSYVLFEVQLKSRCKESQAFLIVLQAPWAVIEFTSWSHDQRRHSQCTDHLKLWIIQQLFPFDFGMYLVCVCKYVCVLTFLIRLCSKSAKNSFYFLSLHCQNCPCHPSPHSVTVPASNLKPSQGHPKCRTHKSSLSASELVDANELVIK